MNEVLQGILEACQQALQILPVGEDFPRHSDDYPSEYCPAFMGQPAPYGSNVVGEGYWADRFNTMQQMPEAGTVAAVRPGMTEDMWERHYPGPFTLDQARRMGTRGAPGAGPTGNHPHAPTMESMYGDTYMPEMSYGPPWTPGDYFEAKRTGIPPRWAAAREEMERRERERRDADEMQDLNEQMRHEEQRGQQYGPPPAWWEGGNPGDQWGSSHDYPPGNEELPPGYIVRGDGRVVRVSVPEDEPEYHGDYPYSRYIEGGDDMVNHQTKGLGRRVGMWNGKTVVEWLGGTQSAHYPDELYPAGQDHPDAHKFQPGYRHEDTIGDYSQYAEQVPWHGPNPMGDETDEQAFAGWKASLDDDHRMANDPSIPTDQLTWRAQHLRNWGAVPGQDYSQYDSPNLRPGSHRGRVMGRGGSYLPNVETPSNPLYLPDSSGRVVNQPRRSGTMTEEQGRRFLEAFNPESAIEPMPHSAYGPIEDADAQAGNYPKPLGPVPTQPQGTRPGARVGGNNNIPGWTAPWRPLSGPMPRPGSGLVGGGRRWVRNSAYDSGHPELSSFPHGQPRRPMERPGFLPTSLRNTTPGMGFFHTGSPTDHIVGSPHPSPKLPPERRKPFGFYADTANWPPSNQGGSDDIYRIGGLPLSPQEGQQWLDEVAARRASSDSDARAGNPQSYDDENRRPMTTRQMGPVNDVMRRIQDRRGGARIGMPAPRSGPYTPDQIARTRRAQMNAPKAYARYFDVREGNPQLNYEVLFYNWAERPESWGGKRQPGESRRRGVTSADAEAVIRGRKSPRGHFGNMASVEEMRERSARREAEQRGGQAGADTHPVYSLYADNDDRRRRWTEIMQGNLYPQHDMPAYLRPFGDMGEETGQAVGFFPKKWEEMQDLSGAADPYCMYGPNVPSFDVQSGKWGWRNPDVNPNFGTSRYPQPGVDDDAEEGFNNPNLYPLGRTMAKTDDDYEEWLAGGGMGNYSEYGSEDYYPSEGTGMSWQDWYRTKALEKQQQNPLPPGMDLSGRRHITDEFGRQYPPQMPNPGGYSQYAGPPTWRQGLSQRDQWNKFWSTEGTDDYRAPYPQGEQDPRQGGPTMQYPVHKPERPLSQPYPGNYAWQPGQPVSPGWSHESSQGDPDAEAWRAWNAQQITSQMNRPKHPRVDDMDHPHRTRDLRDVPNPIIVGDYSRYAGSGISHQPPDEDEYFDFQQNRWVKGDPNYVEEPEEIETNELDYSCGGGHDMVMGCRYMTDMLESMKPTLYDEGIPEIGDTPDRDYWRKKTPYADQPSSHMDMSPEKARKILHDGEVHGHPLTKKQRGLFGSIAGRG